MTAGWFGWLAQLTSPDALDRLPVGTRATANGDTYTRVADGDWLPDGVGSPDTTDELLDRGPVTVLHVPGGAA